MTYRFLCLPQDFLQIVISEFSAKGLLGKLLNLAAYDIVKLTDRVLKDADSCQEAAQNLFFDRVLDYEIKNVNDGRLLTNAVNTPDSLLYDHWVPWQIVIDHNRCLLQIDALAADF